MGDSRGASILDPELKRQIVEAFLIVERPKLKVNKFIVMVSFTDMAKSKRSVTTRGIMLICVVP